MRTRLLFAFVALGLAATAVAGVVALSAVNGKATDASLVTVDVSKLRPGGILTTRYSVSIGNLKDAPVFIADTSNNGVVALVGRSTHLGCRVAYVHAAGYRRFEAHLQVLFEDPCGGSLFGLNGDCLGGPCPRGLDRLKVTPTRSGLRINLNSVITGKARDPNAQLAS